MNKIAIKLKWSFQIASLLLCFDMDGCTSHDAIRDTEDNEYNEIENNYDSESFFDMMDQGESIVEVIDESDNVEDDEIFNCENAGVLHASFNADWDYSLQDIVVEIGCIVLDIVDDDSGFTIISLECQDLEGNTELHEVRIQTEPHLNISLEPAEEITITYLVKANSALFERWLNIRGNGDSLILSGVNAHTLTPADIDPLVLYNPFIIESIDNLCPIENTTCGGTERLALDITYLDSNNRIYDGNELVYEGPPTYYVLLDSAKKYYDNGTCTDQFPFRYTLLIILGSME